MAFDYDLIPDGVIFSVRGNKYLVNCDHLPHESSALLDLSSDENIIRWASKILKAQNFEVVNQLPQLKDKLNELPNDLNIPDDVFELRKKRLIGFPDKLGKMEGFGQILSDFLRSDEGQERIKNYVDTNRDSLLSRYFEEELEKNALEAEKTAQQEIDQQVAYLKQVMTTLNTPLLELEEQVEEDLISLVMTMTRQLVRRELKAEPEHVIGAVRAAMAVLPINDRKLKIFLHPQDVELVKTGLSIEGEDSNWQWVGDPLLTRGGVKLATANTVIDATVEARLNSVINKLLGEERSDDIVE